MKLGQALFIRKDLIKSISDIQDRYVKAAVHTESDAPDEVARDVFTQFEDNIAEIERLTVNINQTNNLTKVGARTMMEAVVHRDSLKLKLSHLTSTVNQMRQRNRVRVFGDHQKEVLAEGVSVVEVAKYTGNVAKELRLLDVAIQEVNWQAELV